MPFDKLFMKDDPSAKSCISKSVKSVIQKGKETFWMGATKNRKLKTKSVHFVSAR